MSVIVISSRFIRMRVSQTNFPHLETTHLFSTPAKRVVVTARQPAAPELALCYCLSCRRPSCPVDNAVCGFSHSLCSQRGRGSQGQAGCLFAVLLYAHLLYPHPLLDPAVLHGQEQQFDSGGFAASERTEGKPANTHLCQQPRSQERHGTNHSARWGNAGSALSFCWL